MRRFLAPIRNFPLALLVVCLLSFGLLIPWLGFYWDDWPTVWYYHSLGPDGFRQVFSVDRPLLGWIFAVTTRLFRDSRLGWQLFGLLARWASALAFWHLLRTLWPSARRLAAWAALLFAVYPGFTQQSIAVTYSSAWLILAAFLLSLDLMVQAARRRERFWPLTLASLLLAAFAVFSTEYFFGLELLRPVLLWLALPPAATALRQQPGGRLSARLAAVGLRWLPYLLLMLVFLYWRLFLHYTPRGEVQVFDQLNAGPLQAGLALAARALRDVFTGSLLAWAQVFDLPRLLASGPAAAALALAVSLLTAAFTFLHLKAGQDADLASTNVGQDANLAPAPILLGLLALFLAGIPFWATDLPIGLDFPWDRFTLAMMFGASLLLAGLIALASRRPLLQIGLLALLAGLAAGKHFDQANIFRREWNLQAGYFWQLAWRVPAIEPGTVLLTAELPFRYFSDNSLTAPLNWVYASQPYPRQIQYLLYDAEARLGKGLEGFGEDLEILESYRTTPFQGSTSRALVVYYTPPGCVRIADPQIDARLPQKPRFYSDALHLSNLDLIHTRVAPGGRPPASIFGPEPAHGWCYYFEKADLARQQGDWEEVARLGEVAFALGERLYEVNAPEYVTYIEGYARTGGWDRAVELTREAYRLTPRMQRMLCENWSRLERDLPSTPEAGAALDAVRQMLDCQPG